MGYEGLRSRLSLNSLVRRRKSDCRNAGQEPSFTSLANALSSREVKDLGAKQEGWAVEARRELLNQISVFFLRNGLDVTPRNLAIAHAAMSGSDLTLAQKVGERQIAGQAISQEWLDEVSSGPMPVEKQREQVDQMMARLERSIAGFAATAKNAQNATANYRGEFSEHLSRADTASQQDENGDFLTISRAMLETLQRIETSMKRSQAETEELQQRLSKARAEADSDHLTGLPNRRAFERELYAAQVKALDHGTPLFLAIADIDHFKRVNDTFGHETGDRLLRVIAQILQKFASHDCFVARHGGEEFVMLLHAESIDNAKDKLDRARREVESRKFVARAQNRPVGKVTFSAGLADVLESENPRDALVAADDALYRSKESGRNQITVAAAKPVAD